MTRARTTLGVLALSFALMTPATAQPTAPTGHGFADARWVPALPSLLPGPTGLDVATPSPQTQGFPVGGGQRPRIFFGAVGGLIVGGIVGIAIPRALADDTCEETCAAMWITGFGGMLFGSALGVTLLSDAPGDAAVGGSALGILGGLAVQVLYDNVGDDDGRGLGGVLGLIAHGAISTLVVERR